MQFYGILIGIASFVLIGVFHPIVIKAEYYFTDKVWPIFLILGLLSLLLSTLITNQILSIITGILGFCFLWSIHELKEQTRRVEKGWFPGNPNRKKKDE